GERTGRCGIARRPDGRRSDRCRPWRRAGCLAPDMNELAHGSRAVGLDRVGDTPKPLDRCALKELRPDPRESRRLGRYDATAEDSHADATGRQPLPVVEVAFDWR